MSDDRVDGAHARMLLQTLGVESDHIGETVKLEELLRAVATSDRVIDEDEQHGALDFALDALTAILRDYGHDVSYECEAGARRALVSCAGKSTTVEGCDLAQIAAALTKLVHGRVGFRGLASGDLVGLSSDEWRKLDRAVPQLVRRVFPAVTAR